MVLLPTQGSWVPLLEPLKKKKKANVASQEPAWSLRFPGQNWYWHLQASPSWWQNCSLEGAAILEYRLGVHRHGDPGPAPAFPGHPQHLHPQLGDRQACLLLSSDIYQLRSGHRDVKSVWPGANSLH